MEVTIGQKLYPGALLTFDDAQKEFNFKIPKRIKISTVMIYDQSAPDPEDPSNSPYLHYLVSNIPNGRIDDGKVLMAYKPPQPPKGLHVYNVILFSQKKLLVDNVRERANFNVDNFIMKHGLTEVERLIFKVNEKKKKKDPPAPDPPSITPTNDHSKWMKPGLAPEKEKYCRCYLQVAAKQTPGCTIQKAWKQVVDGSTCYNPYAVCAKSTHTSS